MPFVLRKLSFFVTRDTDYANVNRCLGQPLSTRR